VTQPRSRRARRQDAAGPRKGDLREAQILDAADGLLASKPFAELTMDEIARQAGLSRSALYFYFDSKEAVLAGLHQRIYEAMSSTVDPITAGLEPTGDAMRAAIAQVCANWRAHPHALRTFHETAMVSPEFGELWRARLDHHVEVLTAIVEAERTAGRAAPAPPPARALVSAWFWMLETQLYELFRRRHTRRAEDDLVDILTLLWFRTIGGTAPAGQH
jgi:TetR/AcrR family transcriptional regulator, ethionamide resistance regulator